LLFACKSQSRYCIFVGQSKEIATAARRSGLTPCAMSYPTSYLAQFPAPTNEPSMSALACKFLIRAERLNLSGETLEKEARIFWAWCTSKGYTNCLFPHLLVAFVNGEYDPQDPSWRP
jgi:hypothetical protein